MMALVPMARTGRQRAIRYLRHYLENDMATVRQAAIRGLGSIPCEESLRILKDHLMEEHDERARASLVHTLHALEGVLHRPSPPTSQDTEILTGP